MSDQDLYERAMERMKQAGIPSSSLSSRIDNVIFLEKEIDDYRRKLDYAESRIKALCAEQMRIIQLEQKLNKERKELHEPATLEAVQESTVGEIIKTISDSGYSISINLFKEESSND